MSPAGKGSDQNDGEISPEDRAEFKKRSAELGRKLEAARPGEDEVAKSAKETANREVLGRVLRLSTELIGGILVGTALGWWLDTYLMPQVFGAKTWPLMFIVFFLLGSAAGMLNVIRSGMKMKTGPSDPSKGPAVRDDEDGDI
ncbi:MAG: AtpZ/AtpI family protein [Alphaproteobacteria bacterium]|nr:AtpZ/AtpI family protein [Alphaproteobacteria bacterium]